MTHHAQSMRILVKENTAEPVQYNTKFFSGPTVYGKQLGYNQVTFQISSL